MRFAFPSESAFAFAGILIRPAAGFLPGVPRVKLPAILAHGTATRLNAAALRRGDRECVGQRGIAVLFVGDREL